MGLLGLQGLQGLLGLLGLLGLPFVRALLDLNTFKACLSAVIKSTQFKIQI